MYNLKNNTVLYNSGDDTPSGAGSSIINIGTLNDNLKGYKLTYSTEEGKRILINELHFYPNDQNEKFELFNFKNVYQMKSGDDHFFTLIGSNMVLKDTAK